MKKFFLMLVAGVMFIWSGSVLAYTIDDDPTVNKVGMGWTKHNDPSAPGWYDVIGEDNFDTKGINVDLSGNKVIITMYTNFEGAVQLSRDTIYAADLGLDLNLDGTYEYGVKLTHTGPDDTDYSAALYKDGTWKSSYDVWENDFGDGIRNHSGAKSNWRYGEFYPKSSSGEVKRKAWVKMIGGTPKGTVGISIDESGSLYAWTLTIDKNLFESGDLDNQMGIFWATGTGANDVVEGVVPIPTTILLLGSGLLGFGLLGRRRKVNT